MDNRANDNQTPQSSSFPSRVVAMAKHVITRGEAEVWARKDMKFLTYDDHDVKLNGYDSDDEEGTLNFALRMSTENKDDDMTENDVSSFPTKTNLDSEPGPSTGHRVNEADRLDDPSQCSTCAACPKFPDNWKTRKLRLFKPSDAFPTHQTNPEDHSVGPVCGHYVAISYCWPISETDDDGNTIEPERMYTIRDIDGSVRKSRALDDILDRAVDVAVDFGLRMIWIDQECLPQPKEDSPEEQKKEQQLGIQAMDIVYNRAHVTAGLHDGMITNQAHMQAISLLKGAGMAQNRPVADLGFLNHVLDFFEMVSLDRWYTRAWVVQEALSASASLMMVFRRGPAISYSFVLGYSRSRESSMNCDSRQTRSENIYISADGFRDMVRVAKNLLLREYTPFGQALIRFDGQPASLLQRAGPILQAAGALHPLLENPNPKKLTIFVKGAYSYAFQFTTDAAGALSMLRTRSCRNQEDRIAIVANMCKWGIRLDTRAAINDDMVRAGLMAVALLNGDLSLLVPEAYSNFATRCFERSRSTLWPPDNFANMINHMKVRNVAQHKMNVPIHLTDQGIGIPAWLWEVEDEFDLSPIKYQWEEDWQSLKCLAILIEPRKNETNSELEERRRQISVHFAKEAVMRQTADELGSKRNPLPADSPVWGPIESEGIRVKRIISAHRIEKMPPMQDIICKVLFGILRYLRNLAETDPRASRLATSIWQSVRVDMVDDRLDLPDEVDQTFFDHPDIVANPFKTLQLDVTPDGEYSQLWIIDRIMEFGTLWVGRYVPFNSAPPQGSTEPPETSQSPPAQDSHSSVGSTYKGKQLASDTDTQRKRYKNQGTLQKQTIRQILGSIVNIATPRDSDLRLLDSAVMVGFAHLVESVNSLEDAEQQVRKRISTFDVEGPCLMATPWNQEWEKLPHADFRSMSVCWVVEPMVLPAGNDEPGASSGHRLGADLDDKGKGLEEHRFETLDPTYRVVDKVRGLWQLMDLPWQRIIFT
ncbi:hypothetical protein F4804DRAFT_156169 [Jackrogersella minutella]|nr:hypothetical protein F4804DRAFT_156169 [Jackrogersella minutella]